MKLLRAIQRTGAVVIIGACFALAATQPLDGRNDDAVEESIVLARRAAETAPDRRVPLDWRPLSFMAYDWLAVFDGHAGRDEIRRRIGFAWPGAEEATLGLDPDTTSVLVFTTGRRVVAWTHVSRRQADFACLAGLRLRRRETRMVLELSSRGHARVALNILPRRYRSRPMCLLPD